MASRDLDQLFQRFGDLWSDETFTLVAGETRQTALHFRPHTVRLRLLDSEGQPIKGILVYAKRADDTRDLHSRTDDAGRADIDKLTSGSWQILMETKDYQVASKLERQNPDVKRSGIRVLGTLLLGEEQRMVTKDFKLPDLDR